GAFGSVSRERYEVVIQGTNDATLNEQTKWLEYQLPCKPGPVDRRPCLVTPYHYRLDWQLWFVPLSPDYQQRWFLSLTRKLLQGDAKVLALFAENPFPARPPRFIRANFYRYQLEPLGAPHTWRRTPAGQYLPPTSLDDPGFVEALRAYGLVD
ncbi:MAG TPA: lipase maturation factor family protein, partial [Polyangiaceae bacterium]|nr:lipase maturation factor family protein [Polyangiaceae bacterium]